MNDKINVSDNENLNINSDTIEVDKDKIIKNLSKRKVFTDNEAFPWLSICLVLLYVFVYGFCVYGKENIVDVEKSFGKIEMRFSLFYVVGILMKV